MTERRATQQLESGLVGLGLTLAGSQIEVLTEFLSLLSRWNRTYRLTAVTDPEEMVARHLLDSLSVLPHVRGTRVLDVGSGPGLPGIPLAVARPDWQFVLLDSNGKKTRFMTHAAGRLGLANVNVIKARVEDYADDIGFDTVISRAFSSMADFVRLTGHLCGPGGGLLAMKGRLREEELTDIPSGWQVVDTPKLEVPGIAGERHLVVLNRDPQLTDR